MLIVEKANSTDVSEINFPDNPTPRLTAINVMHHLSDFFYSYTNTYCYLHIFVHKWDLWYILLGNFLFVFDLTA